MQRLRRLVQDLLLGTFLVGVGVGILASFGEFLTWFVLAGLLGLFGAGMFVIVRSRFRSRETLLGAIPVCTAVWLYTEPMAWLGIELLVAFGLIGAGVFAPFRRKRLGALIFVSVPTLLVFVIAGVDSYHLWFPNQ